MILWTRTHRSHGVSREGASKGSWRGGDVGGAGGGRAAVARGGGVRRAHRRRGSGRAAYVGHAGSGSAARGRCRTEGTATTASAVVTPMTDIATSDWCSPIAATASPDSRLPTGIKPALVR